MFPSCSNLWIGWLGNLGAEQSPLWLLMLSMRENEEFVYKGQLKGYPSLSVSTLGKEENTVQVIEKPYV